MPFCPNYLRRKRFWVGLRPPATTAFKINGLRCMRRPLPLFEPATRLVSMLGKALDAHVMRGLTSDATCPALLSACRGSGIGYARPPDPRRQRQLMHRLVPRSRLELIDDGHLFLLMNRRPSEAPSWVSCATRIRGSSRAQIRGFRQGFDRKRSGVGVVRFTPGRNGDRINRGARAPQHFT